MTDFLETYRLRIECLWVRLLGWETIVNTLGELKSSVFCPQEEIQKNGKN